MTTSSHGPVHIGVVLGEAFDALAARPLVVRIPGLTLTNRANGSHGHWSRRAVPAKHQRSTTTREIRTALLVQREPLPALPVTVTVTRVGPGRLDEHDGLPNACKHVVDGVADAYGLRDSDPRFTWRYAQRSDGPGAYAVEITIASARGVL